MTLEQILQDVDFWAGTDENTYTPETKIANANRAAEKISARIIKNSYRWTFIDDNSADFYIAYGEVSGGEDNIALEVDHLNLERVRIKQPGGTFVTLRPKARREIPDHLLDNQGVPQFYYRQGQSLVFAPIPQDTYEVEVEFQKGLQPFTLGDLSVVPGFNSQFHRLISLYVAKDYVAINDQSRYQVVQNEIQQMEAEIDDFYQKRTRDEITHLSVATSRRHIY